MTTGINYLDEVWNVVSGCSGKGCKAHCWAREYAKFRPTIHGYTNGPGPNPDPLPFSTVNFHPERLDKPLHWRKPRRVGVCFTGDLFDEQVRDELIVQVFDIMRQCPQHQFFVLTKQPRRMADFALRLRFTAIHDRGMWLSDDRNGKGYRVLGGNGCTGMPWVHLGISITDQDDADRMIPEFLQIPGKRWVSWEPALGPVDMEDINDIDWFVLGCESGPRRRPCPHAWMIDVVEQCRAASVPVWVKQIDLDGRVCHDISRFPKELQVRQWPECVSP